MRLTRRGLLIAGLAGGGLAIGYVLRPREFPLPLEPGRDEVAFGAWIKIAGDGVVTVAVPQLEMGQGITTLIPQIVAEELGADWRLVAVEPAPLSAHYANLPLAARWSDLWSHSLPGLPQQADSFATRRWAEDSAFMATADGLSLAAYEAPAREAAASARAMLAMAAGERWDVDWRECTAGGGFVRHGRRRLSFGALAADASAYHPPDPPILRHAPAKERPAPAGSPLRYPRLDLPSKVDGSHVFAGDVRLPNLVHAAIRHGPAGDAQLAGFSRSAAAGTPGLVGIVRHKRWLAAVGRTWWAAERALTAMAPRFRVANHADSAAIEKSLEDAVRFGKSERSFEAGDADVLTGGDYSLAVRYGAAPALHAPLETASATARLTDGRLELWVASQAPDAVRRAAAAVLGIDVGRVVVYPVSAGGSFDRRLECEHAVEAALIAREIGRPVQLTWSRWQEHLAGRPRPPVSAVLAARTNAEGSIFAWKARIAAPAVMREFGARQFSGKSAVGALEDSANDFDPFAVEGAVPPYAIENLVVEHVPVRTGLPSGRLRGNAHGYTCFFTESFVDELAVKAKREPLSFRIAMLEHEPRLVRCLQSAARLANWDGGRQGSGQGLACHVIARAGAPGYIAVVASARPAENGVRVDKISVAADIGRIVNLDIARQQIEGGLVFGIGLALGSSSDYANGLPVSGRLGQLNLPLLADCPEIEVEFIDSDAAPADPGELGVAVTAPAIANALHSATGLRFRRLPLLSEDA